VDWLESFAATPNHPLGLLLIFLSAGIEYVFPPFPGDTVMLAAAVLVGRWEWSLPLVFSVVMAGSLVGAALDFLLGKWLHAWRAGKDRKADKALAVILDGFKRWGIWLIAVNRFLPGIRAFFFIAAGMAGFRLIPVMAMAFVSALAWNVLIMLVGLYVASQYDRLKGFFGAYNMVVWIVMGVVTLALAAWWLIRRRGATAAK
jgi:membrane protein DedA with SNARE-associated domain